MPISYEAKRRIHLGMKTSMPIVLKLSDIPTENSMWVRLIWENVTVTESTITLMEISGSENSATTSVGATEPSSHPRVESLQANGKENKLYV